MSRIASLPRVRGVFAARADSARRACIIIIEANGLKSYMTKLIFHAR
jgi:hypothetical protein